MWSHSLGAEKVRAAEGKAMVVVVTAAVLVPQDGYGIGEMHYPSAILFFTPGTALTVLIAPLVGCVDLTFPELNLSHHQTMWCVRQ